MADNLPSVPDDGDENLLDALTKDQVRSEDLAEREIDPAILKAASEQMDYARIRLISRSPFFGELILRLPCVAETKWCKSISTDGRFIYFNPEYIVTLRQPEITFVISHVLTHVMLGHMNRRSNRIREIYDAATDFVTNDIVYTSLCVVDKNESFDSRIVSKVRPTQNIAQPPAGSLFDSRYTSELTVEEVYSELIRNKEEHQKKGHTGFNGQSGGSFDQHGDVVQVKGGDGESGGADGEGNVTLVMRDGSPVPAMTQEEMAQIEYDMRQAVSSIIAAKGAGVVPLGLQRYVEDLLAPKIPWKKIIAATIRSRRPEGMHYAKLSRRPVPRIVRPSKKPRKRLEAVIVIDTSGSMSQQMLTEILSETISIMETFGDFKLTVWTFDTQVYGYTEFTPENKKDIYEYKMQGGGGTDFNVNWEFMREEGIKPDTLIFFTDGYPCSGWGDPDWCKTVFVIHGNTSIQAPFGRTTYYDE